MASQAQSLIAEIQARFPGALVQGRGRKHLDFGLPDGRSVFVAEIADLHYRDGLGQWQEVDEGLVDDGVDGFAKRCDRTRHAFRVGSGGTRRWYPRREVATEYVDITAIQYWQDHPNPAKAGFKDITLPTAVWKTSGADWDLANLHASITNTWRRVKADFVLKDATAPTRLRFAVTLVGLTLGADWHLTSTTDAVDVGSIDPPTAEDANESPVAVSAVYSGGYIEWAADTSAAAFPVTVDPTFTDGYGGDVNTATDTVIATASAAQAYGAIAHDYVQGEGAVKALLRFDLSSIAAGSTCDSATLYLYRSSAGEDATKTISLYSMSSANSDWVEGPSENPATQGQSTWDNKNDYNGGAPGDVAWAGTAGASTSGTDYEATALGSFDSIGNSANGTEHTCALTTTRIDDWFGGNTNNYGLLMLQPAAGLFHYFGSSDNGTTAYRPKLVVVYTAGGGVTARPWRQAQLGVQW